MTFGELSIGNVFSYMGVIYLKTEEFWGFDGGHNAVSITGHNFIYLYDDEEIACVLHMRVFG